MDEHLYLKGQRIITKEGDEGEIMDVIGDTIRVKLDNGAMIDLPSSDLTDNSSAG